MGSEGRSLQGDTEIHLKTSNETFILMLHEDSSFAMINIDPEMLSNETYQEDDTETKYYVGVLKNYSLRSYVTGYVSRNLFSGYIVNESATLFVEPLKSLSLNDTAAQKVTIYQGKNIKLSYWINSSNSIVNISSILLGRYNMALNRSIKYEDIDLANHTKDLFCEVEVVADYTLYNFFNKNIQKLKAYIYLHVKYADKVFRKTDFNMDGKTDGIRISIAKISVYKTPYDDNYPMIEAVTLEQYLTKLLYRKQTYPFCLSISMSYLPFKGPAIGQAFKPDLTPPNFFSGICEKPIEDLDNNENMLHFNVAAVNLRISTFPLLPLAITTLAFTHEIGHAFGSDHDPTILHMCSPATGKYLMYPKTLPTPIQRSEFSPCSRISIAKIIRLKGGCLKTRNATCGNAIREDGEECDCGTKSTCGIIDPCCTPSDVEPPEIGCTFRKKNSFECSPKESACCTENCTTSNDTSLTCYSDSFLCLKSFCDGVNPECPEPEKDFAICPTKAVACNETICNSSLCQQLGLQECFCWGDAKNECYICCQQESNCVPASTLGLFNGSLTPYVHEEGTSCNYNASKCDGEGRCVTEYRKKHRSRRIFWSLMFVGLFAVVALAVTMHLVRKRVNRPLLLLRNPLLLLPNRV
ncbi:hypothetical protein JTE90_000555 [Oedothorax gibbosus]|uniref:Disintegrin and metalloproteinase domain-containing protein 10 n=1 Tax=Oedothorax gibbosus TaxID=931172 RepID=A0AAV6VUZ3_9ARAC|nr:hypothetical protein JTE90_000555 [Oedothorax gibbosus]